MSRHYNNADREYSDDDSYDYEHNLVQALPSPGKWKGTNLQYIEPHDFVGNWYQNECSFARCPRWKAFPNAEGEKADLEDRTAKFPIIRRLGPTGEGWKTVSFIIQGQAMRKILSDVLKGYQDLDIEVEDYTFEEPFQPLVHRWDALQGYGTKIKDDPDAKSALSDLLAFLTPIVDTGLSFISKAQKTGKATFDELWHVFNPGSLVITKLQGIDIICRILKYDKGHRTSLDPKSWVFDLEYVDWNGTETGFTTTRVQIVEFKGFKRIRSLPMFPISYHSEEAKVRESHIERGRKFERLRGFHLMSSEGAMRELDGLRRPIEGRLCIDAFAFYMSHDVATPQLRSLQGQKGGHIKSPLDMKAETGVSSKLLSSSTEHRSQPIADHPAKRMEDLRPLTDEQLLMTTPWLLCFDLKAKIWGKVCIDDLGEVTWNDQAFDRLVLPKNEKEMAWSFVKGKELLDDQGFDDFVNNKGRGLIVLMFGPPGVGKTFTAEAIAEKLRRPLYSMSAGDLGTKPSSVENALKKALKLCTMWNAMLLLDEADVFLSSRSTDSLTRNELVSIFLRTLEYYAGTLFLTTNRVTDMDHAFQSRVDLFLPYDHLTKQVRRQIWGSFLERAGHDTFPVADDTLDQLSEIKLNGREIKNLVKSAQMLLLGDKDNELKPLDVLFMLADNRTRALKPLSP
ncbi:hypothetical protein M426DRAFT_259837 [Hypoxylon sp. CI-4A]|nr:hypothetical protein M426DRAFT_259837 [Hypoxylon sp. CI-4A]